MRAACYGRGQRALTVSQRLSILSVSPFPASPPTFGAQRRIQGLVASLALKHDVDAVALVPPELDAAASERAMRGYCRKVFVIPAAPTAAGFAKRWLQLRSLFSPWSFEHHHFSVPALQAVLDDLLVERRYDVVSVAFCFLGHYQLRRAPQTGQPPALFLDEHNIEYDLSRQMMGKNRGIGRSLHHALNWRKVRHEEVAAWRRFDGVTFTSAPDQMRARAVVPSLRSRVVPNAVDVEFFRPRPEDPLSDARTVLFFGTLNYFPNLEGVLYFLREIWPRLSESHPEARLKIVGAAPPPEVLAYRSPRVELTGLVDDLRPHLAQAAVAIAPLLVGGGTRLKIVEAMAMAKAVVSTSLGAEGIAATPDKQILIADTPESFAAAVGRALDNAGLRASLGQAARALVEQRYSWQVAAESLEDFFHEVLTSKARL